MVETRNEVAGVGGYGGFGFGGESILGIIALMSIFRNNLFGGDYAGAHSNLAEVQNQLANIRHDIGQAEYDVVKGTLDQTIGLMNQINDGRVENLSQLFNQTMALEAEFQRVNSHICGIEKDVLTNRYELGKSIQQMGYENQIGNLQQTIAIKDQLTAMQHNADKCCCETNRNIERSAAATELLIERTSHETQLRDLSYKADTDKQLAELKCGQGAIMAKIDESRLLEENARLKEKVDALRERNDRNFLSAEIATAANKNIASTYGHWWADRAFNGDTYPTPGYPSGPWMP